MARSSTREQRELQLLRGDAPARLRQAYSDAMRFLAAVQRDADRARAAAGASGLSRRIQTASTRLDQNRVARAVGGDVARKVGIAAGVGRGAVHAVQGIGEGAVFLGRLANPYDDMMSAPGQSAADQLAASGRQALDYVKKGVADPRSVIRDVQAKGRQMSRDLDPSATPQAPTFARELRRNFYIGQNQGELAFEVGSFAAGGPFAKPIGAVLGARKASTAAKYLAQGFGPQKAAYLAEPYDGIGHHFRPQRFDGSDGPFNVLKPPGVSRGDFYELHFQVDPESWGNKFPVELGRGKGSGWSGKRLGLQRYGLPGRIWYGSPAPLKVRVIGSGAGTGGLVYDDPE